MNNQRFEIYSKVVGGKLTRNKARISEIIQSFEGKDVTISIERTRSKRSGQQNRFYYGFVVPLVQQRLRELGNLFSKESTHELLKHAITKVDPQLMVDEIIMESTGEVLSRTKSTTELSTSQFMDYITHIQMWAQETLDLEIPDPESQMEINIDQTS